MSPSEARTLFSGLSAELAAMMETVESLASLVAEHARLTPADDRSDVLVRAQAVDDLHQKLDSLRALCGALSSGASIENALADVPLAGLAERLQSICAGTPVGRASPASPGDLVLFE